MKKSILSVLLMVFLAALMVGCEPGNVTPTDYDKTIIFYSSQGDKLQGLTALAIESFEAKYPGWKVIHTPQGGYDDVRDKIVADLQGGLQPDLAYCYADHVALYLQTGKVVDMAKLINSEATVLDKDEKEVRVGYTAEEIADFVPGYYAEGKATNFANYEEYGYTADSMFTLPFVKSTELLYVNETALIKAGFKNEDGTAKVATTWDELWAQGATLVKKYSTATVLGYDSEANWFITMCEQNSWGYTSTSADNHYLFNNDHTKAWLEELAGYYKKGYIVTQMDYGAYTSNLFTKGADDGGVIYCIGSSGGASYQATDAFQWGVYAIPGSKQADGTVNRSVISQGPNLVMLECGRCSSDEAKELKKQMTFLFMKELLDPEFQAQFSIDSGYNPSTQSTYQVDAYVDHLKGKTITAKACVVAKTLTNDFFTSPAFVGSSGARTQVGNALNFAVTGQKTAEKALADAYSNCGGK